MKQYKNDFKNRASGLLAGLLLGIWLLAPMLAVADDDGGAKKGLGRGRMVAVLRIAEKLGLDDAETIRMAGVFSKAEAERRALAGRRKALTVELETQLALPAPDPARLGTLTVELTSVQRALALSSDTLFTQLGRTLDVEQRAKLAILKDRLQRQVAREQAHRRAKRREKAGKKK
jgi:hypothetical protein